VQQELLAAGRWGKALGAAGDAATFRADARRRLEVFGVSPGQVDRILKTGKPIDSVTIFAPEDGHVLRKTAVEGLYVEPNSELFVIYDLSRVWALADVYESEMPYVRVGLAADLELPAYPGRSFAGTVEFVYPTVDPQTRALRVRLAFENPNLELRPGMYGAAKLRLPAEDVLTIPREALVDTGEHQYVFLSQPDGVFEPRPVTTGRRAGDGVEVRSGLVAGQVVVTTANFLVDSESRLRAAIEGFGGGAGSPGAAAPSPPAGHAGH
jgi:membrane fusion protein, copper/silver efflux system